jgi:hypothetical protein
VQPQRELVERQRGPGAEERGEHVQRGWPRAVRELRRADAEHEEDPVDLVVQVHTADARVPERSSAGADRPGDEARHEERDQEGGDHPAGDGAAAPEQRDQLELEGRHPRLRLGCAGRA